MANGQQAAAEAQAIGKRSAFWRGILTDLAIMTVIGLFLAIIGPFGSIELPLPVRLLSWLAFAYIGYIVYRPMAFVVAWLEEALHLPRFGLWVGAVIVATVPMTVAVQAISNLDHPFRWPGLEIALTSYFYVLVIGGAVTLLFNLINTRLSGAPIAETDAAQPQPPAAPPSPEPPANPLIDQLPAEIGSDIIALEMEDHYVRVHTALGSDLVLMRLRDAMVHVAEIEGRQVHRSWWVARLAVEEVKREGRNVRLVLARGIEAPVARAQVSELKDAGWL